MTVYVKTLPVSKIKVWSKAKESADADPQTVESQMKTACRRAQAAHPNFGTICDRDQNSTNKIHTDQAGFGDLHLSVL